VTNGTARNKRQHYQILKQQNLVKARGGGMKAM
jgi:hypothetical protein